MESGPFKNKLKARYWLGSSEEPRIYTKYFIFIDTEVAVVSRDIPSLLLKFYFDLNLQHLKKMNCDSGNLL